MLRMREVHREAAGRSGNQLVGGRTVLDLGTVRLCADGAGSWESVPRVIGAQDIHLEGDLEEDIPGEVASSPPKEEGELLRGRSSTRQTSWCLC